MLPLESETLYDFPVVFMHGRRGFVGVHRSTNIWQPSSNAGVFCLPTLFAPVRSSLPLSVEKYKPSFLMEHGAEFPPIIPLHAGVWRI